MNIKSYLGKSTVTWNPIIWGIWLLSLFVMEFFALYFLFKKDASLLRIISASIVLFGGSFYLGNSLLNLFVSTGLLSRDVLEGRNIVQYMILMIVIKTTIEFLLGTVFFNKFKEFRIPTFLIVILCINTIKVLSFVLMNYLANLVLTV